MAPPPDKGGPPYPGQPPSGYPARKNTLPHGRVKTTETPYHMEG